MLCFRMPPVQFVSLHRSESTAAFLTSIGDALISISPSAIALLTCSDDAKEADGQFLLICGDKAREADVKTWGAEIASCMDGRGGGRAGRYQGKVAKVQQRQAAYEYALKQIQP